MSASDHEIIENPEVMTVEQRLAQLEQDRFIEMHGGDEKGFVNRQLMEIIQNPGALKQKFNLTDKQAENVAAALTMGGAGLASKYLAKHFGYEIAGGVGGMLGGFIARKLAGG